MTAVKGGHPDHVMSLLGLVLQGVRHEMAEVAAECGPGGLWAAEGLRTSQLRLLSLTPDGGLTLTALAERVGMTKQALGEFADDLEGRGLLESVRDPADRRVRILRLTSAGRAAVEAGDELIRVAEARYRDRLGAQQWDRLRDLLLAAHHARPER
jgi:DNA-binding MarR family transcriptional regulator